MSDNNLADLIGQLGNGIHDATEGIQEGINALVHDAAVELLNSVLPAMVHARNAAVRSSGWLSVEAATAEIEGRTSGVTVGNAVLAGLVKKKVEHGIGQITSNLDYAHGVNSIS